MYLLQDEFYHIYNRGNNKQLIFFNDNNYFFFLKKLREQISPCADIICYCQMPNHFHLIIRANEKTVAERISFGGKPMQEFAYRIGILLSSYTQAINNQNKTTGSLFQQKTKAKILCEEVEGKKEDYLEKCFFYVLNNPFAAGLVLSLNDWPYSSYLDYIELRNGSLCNKEILFQQTGLTAKDIISRSVSGFTPDVIEKFYL
jgi:putative transposase